MSNHQPPVPDSWGFEQKEEEEEEEERKKRKAKDMPNGEAGDGPTAQ